MKRKIRKSVFETNSSSVHTLTIADEGRELSCLKKNKENEIIVDFGQFGREYQIYNSQYDKLSYLITCLFYLVGYNDMENFYNSYEFRMVEGYICEYAKANGICILNKEMPAIDHQSAPYDGIDIINIYDEDSVVNFVFNKYISLKTESD